MNGDFVNLENQKAKKPKPSGSEPSAAKEADAAAAAAKEKWGSMMIDLYHYDMLFKNFCKFTCLP